MPGFILRVFSWAVSLIMLALFAFAQPAAADARPVTSTELIEQAATLSGQEVAFTGEAIGERMIRGSYAWINASDGVNAIGLWMTAEQARQVKSFGSYGFRGDTITVTGVFNRACAEHGGDLDIHATSLSVVMPGEKTPHPVNAGRVAFAIVLTALAGALAAFDWRRAQRVKHEAQQDHSDA